MLLVVVGGGGRAGGLRARFRVPAAPADFFKGDGGGGGGALVAAAVPAAFERADDEPPRFGGGDAGEARHAGRQVRHYVADGEGAVREEDAGEVVCREEGGRDGPGGVAPREQVLGRLVRERPVRGQVLRGGVLDRVLEVDVGVDVGGARGGGRRPGRVRALGVLALGGEGLGGERRRDGVRGRGEHAGLLFGGEGARGDGREGVAAGVAAAG